MVATIPVLRQCLVDTKQPIQKRTHAAFFLRTDGSPEAVDAISAALVNKEDSALLRHELAYILGQIQNPVACKVLSAVLQDCSDDTMVRHEAAESLGAIGDPSAVQVLESFVNDPAAEVADTCKLSLELIRWRTGRQGSEGGALDKSPYLSVDPAPADRQDLTVAELRDRLMDTSLDLFTRYRAMFSLRNRNTEEAALALAEGFKDGNPLFRHEVAYVMGQMQNPATVPALRAVLQDESEHRMVRHEAAEALGAVGGQASEEVLKGFLADSEDVVRESCEVALDTMEYWLGNDAGDAGVTDSSEGQQ